MAKCLLKKLLIDFYFVNFLVAKKAIFNGFALKICYFLTVSCEKNVDFKKN